MHMFCRRRKHGSSEEPMRPRGRATLDGQLAEPLLREAVEEARARPYRPYRAFRELWLPP